MSTPNGSTIAGSASGPFVELAAHWATCTHPRVLQTRITELSFLSGSDTIMRNYLERALLDGMWPSPTEFRPFGDVNSLLVELVARRTPEWPGHEMLFSSDAAIVFAALRADCHASRTDDGKSERVFDLSLAASSLLGSSGLVQLLAGLRSLSNFSAPPESGSQSERETHILEPLCSAVLRDMRPNAELLWPALVAEILRGTSVAPTSVATIYDACIQLGAQSDYFRAAKFWHRWLDWLGVAPSEP